MDFSLLGLWNQMGLVARIVVLILLAMSAYSIAIALERFVTFRKGRQRSLEFVAALGPSRNILWATGPSKTADVEGILIEGVHGPGEQVALFV